MPSKSFMPHRLEDHSVGGILSACRRLERLRKGMPGAALSKGFHLELNDCFEEIDEIIRCTSPDDAANLMRYPELRSCQEHLQQLRAYYECIEEEALATRMLASDKPGRDIDGHIAAVYPITAIHTDLFKQSIRKKKSCLLVGCGALPSTALLLLQETGLELHCIDRIGKSCMIGERIVNASRKRSASFACIDAMDLCVFKEWDVIFVSVLAGVKMDESVETNRNALIDHLLHHAEPGTMIALRSAYGLAKLVYPSVDQERIKARKIVEIAAPISGRSSLILFEV